MTPDEPRSVLEDMHSAVLVFGDDVEAAMERAVPETQADWWAIGGRFTGRLIPTEGAVSARVWGDAAPGFETTVLSELGLSRSTAATRGPGVDQVRMSELAEALGEFFFVATPDEFLRADEALIVDSMLESAGPAGGFMAPLNRARHKRMDDLWRRRISDLARELRRAGDPLVTVVDIHH